MNININTNNCSIDTRGAVSKYGKRIVLENMEKLFKTTYARPYSDWQSHEYPYIQISRGSKHICGSKKPHKTKNNLAIGLTTITYAEAIKALNIMNRPVDTKLSNTLQSQISSSKFNKNIV